MVTNSPPLGRTQKAASRNRLTLLLIALLLLSGAAVYTWTLPGRREKTLQTASLAELNVMAKQGTNDPRVFYHIGRRLQEAKRFVPARIAFQHASEMDADDEEAWLAWASAAQSVGDTQEAFNTLTIYLKAHPQSAAAHKALAAFYYAQEVYVHAQEEALAAAKINANDAAAWRIAGVAALKLDTYSAAEEDFRKAVSLAPKEARALIGLGDALDKQEKHKEALECYRGAYASAPNDPTATLSFGKASLQAAATPADVTVARQVLELANQQDAAGGHALLPLGRAYVREKQWDKAREILERAKVFFPDADDVAYELQPVYIHFGETEKAAAEGKRHDVLYAYSSEVYNLLTRLHEAKGDLDRQLRLQLSRLYASHHDYAKAAREYRQLVRRAPDLVVAQKELADVERKMGQSAPPPSHNVAPVASAQVASLVQEGETLLTQNRFANAQTPFLKAVQQNPHDAQAVQGLGLALAGQDKTGEAFTALNQALKLDATLPKAQYALARLYYKNNLPDEATHRLEKLVQQVPNDPETLHALGICYLNTVRAQQAEQMFARAAALKPDNASYWTHLANAEVQNEKSADAEQHYRRALQVTPTDVEAKAGLAKLLLNHEATPTRQQEAEQLFRAVLVVDSLNEDALLGLGRLLVERNQPQEAVTHLETLINHDADVVQAYFQLAKAYDQLGSKDRAAYCRKVFKTISEFQSQRDDTLEQVRIHLKDPALRLKLARLYTKGGQFPLALNQYQMCLHLDAKNGTAKKELADLTARLKASGQLASATTFNNMVSASLTHK